MYHLMPHRVQLQTKKNRYFTISQCTKWCISPVLKKQPTANVQYPWTKSRSYPMPWTRVFTVYAFLLVFVRSSSPKVLVILGRDCQYSFFCGRTVITANPNEKYH